MSVSSTRPMISAEPGAILATMLDVLHAQEGQYFGAIGLRFTLFETIDCFALAVVQGGRDLEITLLGLVGEILISAVQRKQAELALHDSQLQLAQSQKLEAVCLRFGTVNGPSTRLRGELMLNKMVSDGLGLGTVTVRNGRVWRPILSIDDLVQALVAVIDSDCKSGIFNLCSVNLTIREYANAVAHLTGARIEVLADTPTYNFIMSSQKFCDTFGFEFTTNLYTIVETLIEFYREQGGGAAAN